MSWLGVVLDESRNSEGEGERIISAGNSRIKVLVVPADEEKMIAWETRAVLQKH